ARALRQLPLGRRAGSIQANDVAALRSLRLSLAKNSAAALDSGRQGSEAGRQMPVVLALLGALRAALGGPLGPRSCESSATTAACPAPPPREAAPVRTTRSPLLDVALAAVGAVARGAPCRRSASTSPEIAT